MPDMNDYHAYKSTSGGGGVLYGYDSIPEEWRKTLIKREYIENLCKRAIANWNKL